MIPVWGELPSWFMTGASCRALRWWEESWSSRGLFYKGTYIVHEVSTWPKAHILTPSCLGLWYQYINFGAEILRQFHGSRYSPLYLKILNSALNYHKQYYSNPITIFFLNFIWYWGVADWQCYDTFRWTVKGPSHTCTGIHSPSNSPPILAARSNWAEFPVLYSRSFVGFPF